MDIRTPVPTIYGNWITKFGAIWKEQASKLSQAFGDKIEQILMPGENATDMPIIYVRKDAMVDVLRFMKSEAGFEYEFLSDITATDELGYRDQRFDVVYHLYAINRGPRIRLKAKVAEGEEMPTASGIWKAANWAEREIWDMFGIKFTGHPDLRRILMDERWVGHPLRKDYPLRGYQVFTEPMQAHTELLD
jgi:NADH-quinone oxidoreductase subunit C